MSIVTFIVVLIMGLGFLYIGTSVFAKSCLLLVNLLHKGAKNDWIKSNAWPITKKIVSRCMKLAKYAIAQAQQRQPKPVKDWAVFETPTSLRKGTKIICG